MTANKQNSTLWSALPVLFLGLLSLLPLPLPSLASLWQYDRVAIAEGQWWRLLTGHLTHWNGEHWIWDGLTYVTLGWICAQRMPVRTGWTIVGAAIAIAAALWLGLPTLPWYRGLSGIDTALFTLLAMDLLRQAMQQKNRLLSCLVALSVVGLLVKLSYELLTGQTLFVNSQEAGFDVITLAHVVGAAVGMLVYIIPIREPRSSLMLTYV